MNHITSSTKQRLDELETRKEELEISITQEKLEKRASSAVRILKTLPQ